MICIFIFFDQMTTGAYFLAQIHGAFRIISWPEIHFLRGKLFIENAGRNVSDRVPLFDVNYMMPGDVDACETPVFEIFFVMETVGLLYLGISYFIFDVTLTVLNIFIVTEFKILQHRVEVVFQPEENPDKRYLQCQELIDCIHKQNELIWIVEKMENVFSMVILGQMLMSSLLICVTGYAVMSGIATIVKTCLYAAHLMGDCTQLLLITISCNDLMTESSNVSDAIYRSNWYLVPNDSFGKFVRKNVQIIMIRSQKCCYLSAGGFVAVSLQTFTKVMSTAGSYFALLRHLEEEVPAP
ncbi:odorant receptor 13a-like [Orussus abietinus]|uniref:odorant receptor 13a-like n=1 Tax=Orussus abietinus TaxID=222816 RepID=UPI0006261ED4|nr:odorant receptor 13a-like [Orussus abietinus]